MKLPVNAKRKRFCILMKNARDMENFSGRCVKIPKAVDGYRMVKNFLKK